MPERTYSSTRKKLEQRPVSFLRFLASWRTRQRCFWSDRKKLMIRTVVKGVPLPVDVEPGDSCLWGVQARNFSVWRVILPIAILAMSAFL